MLESLFDFGGLGDALRAPAPTRVVAAIATPRVAALFRLLGCSSSCFFEFGGEVTDLLVQVCNDLLLLNLLFKQVLHRIT